MVLKRYLCLLSWACLAACGPAVTANAPAAATGNLPGAGGAADTPQGSLGGVELCDAATYRPLVGQPYTGTAFPVGPKLRVYSDIAVVTQEYLPNRTNVVYDARSGVILRAFCG